MTEIAVPAIVALTQGVLSAAQAVALPLQAGLTEQDPREQQVKWFGIAYEALSFYLVVTTRVALMYSLPVAQSLGNAVYRCILPELAARFFSRNPPDAQAFMLEHFKAGHYLAETAYGACKKVHPDGLEPDPEAMLCLYIERLLSALGDERARAKVQSVVFTTVNGERGFGQLLPLIQAACEGARTPPSN
jgi:hypothetical protein